MRQTRRLPPHEELVNAFEFEDLAKRALTAEAFSTIAGSDRSAFDRLTFRPRMCIPVLDLDLTVDLFGDAHFTPIVVGPNAIGFTCPKFFNDPLEVEALHLGARPSNTILSSFLRFLAKEEAGVLSLTRAPLNALMWAHYGVAHTGMVIGLDATLPEFVSEETNLLPVQYGSVNYTNERPLEQLLGTHKPGFGNEFSFRIDALEHLQRMFLFKPMCWSYEEEVRVVKWLRGVHESSCIKSGTFRVIAIGERPLYLLDLPRGAIREVFLGIRSQPLIQSKEGAFVEALSAIQPGAKVFGCRISQSTWNLEKYELGALPAEPRAASLQVVDDDH